MDFCLFALIKSSAACSLTKTWKYEYITPVLTSLHWLSCQVRADFKVLLLTYKALNGLAPSYLSDLLHLYIPPCALQSQGTGLLKVPRARKINLLGSMVFFFCLTFMEQGGRTTCRNQSWPWLFLHGICLFPVLAGVLFR